MKLRSIYLENFRSYNKLRLNINKSNFVILTGRNGIGKTNLLEALSFLAPGKGFRNSKLDDILKKRTEGKSLLEAIGHQVHLGDAQKEWMEIKYTSENLTPAHVQVQNRVKILELADKNRISVFDVATASERDSEYKGSPHKYIEWLKFKVREPDQQVLLQERMESIETGMKMPPEKIEEAKEQYRSWKKIPGVRAVEELFKSDEQKAKDLENLLKV